MNKKYIENNSNKTLIEVFCPHCNTQLAAQCEYQYGISCPPCSDSIAACQGCYIYKTCAVDNRDPPCSKRFELASPYRSGIRGILGEPGIDFTLFSTNGLVNLKECIEKEIKMRKELVTESKVTKIEFIKNASKSL